MIDENEINASNESAQEELFVPDQKAVSFNQNRPFEQPTTDKKVVLTLLRESMRTVNKLMEANEELFNKMEAGEFNTQDKDAEWLQTVALGISNTQMDDTLDYATEREGSRWVQSMEYDGKQVRPGKPKQKIVVGEKHTDDEILAYLNKRSNRGGSEDFPMVHSGVWIRLRPTINSEVVQFKQRLANLKERVGRTTKGNAFSNASALLMNETTDFALSLLQATNTKYTTPNDLEDQLTTLDEILLHHAVACMMFPNGFTYSHACVADPKKCNHIEHALLNLNALAWYDETAFTTRQKDILTTRFNTNKLFDLEQLKEYRDQFNCGKQRIVWNGEVGLSLEVPTIRRRKEAATRWFDDIAKLTNGAFNEPQSGANRNAFVDAVTRATQARQYAHYVTGIWAIDEETHEPILVSDKISVIDKYLEQVLSEEEMMEWFDKQIKDYIRDSTVGLVAIPSWNCPKCNSPQATKFHERFDHLINLDMILVFFTLIAQRVPT